MDDAEAFEHAWNQQLERMHGDSNKPLSKIESALFKIVFSDGFDARGCWDRHKAEECRRLARMVEHYEGMLQCMPDCTLRFASKQELDEWNDWKANVFNKDGTLREYKW